MGLLDLSLYSNCIGLVWADVFSVGVHCGLLIDFEEG